MSDGDNIYGMNHIMGRLNFLLGKRNKQESEMRREIQKKKVTSSMTKNIQENNANENLKGGIRNM